jgi:hypothetical protein
MDSLSILFIVLGVAVLLAAVFVFWYVVVMRRSTNESFTTDKVIVVTTTSANYAPIFEAAFDSTIDRSVVDVRVFNTDLSMYTEFGFQTEAWYVGVKAKIDNLLSVMNEQAEGTYVVMSDADIQFFNTRKIPDLVEHARANALDFYGMEELDTHDFNTGFFVVRNNQNTRDLLNLSEFKHPSLGDQSIINERLGLLNSEGNEYGDFAQRIKYDFIPKKHIIQARNVPVDPSPETIDDIMCHHATHVTNTEDKIEQLRWVREWYVAHSL